MLLSRSSASPGGGTFPEAFLVICRGFGFCHLCCVCSLDVCKLPDVDSDPRRVLDARPMDTCIVSAHLFTLAF